MQNTKCGGQKRHFPILLLGVWMILASACQGMLEGRSVYSQSLFKTDINPILEMQWSTPQMISFISDEFQSGAPVAYLGNLDNSQVSPVETQVGSSITLVSITSDASLLAVKHLGGQVEIFNYQNKHSVATIPIQGSRSLAWSSDGKQLAILEHIANHHFAVRIFNREGREEKLLYEIKDDTIFGAGHLAWSPDDTKVAFILERGVFFAGDLYIADVEDNSIQQINIPNMDEQEVSWSRRTDQILLIAIEEDPNSFIYRILILDMSNSCYRVVQNIDDAIAATWSPTSNDIAIMPRQSQEVYLVSFSSLVLSEDCISFE